MLWTSIFRFYSIIKFGIPGTCLHDLRIFNFCAPALLQGLSLTPTNYKGSCALFLPYFHAERRDWFQHHLCFYCVFSYFISIGHKKNPSKSFIGNLENLRSIFVMGSWILLFRLEQILFSLTPKPGRMTHWPRVLCILWSTQTYFHIKSCQNPSSSRWRLEKLIHIHQLYPVISKELNQENKLHSDFKPGPCCCRSRYDQMMEWERELQDGVSVL